MKRQLNSIIKVPLIAVAGTLTIQAYAQQAAGSGLVKKLSEVLHSGYK